MLAVALGAVAMPHAAPADAPVGQPNVRADLVLYNGRVITVDGAFSIAEAVAIAGDRIVAVGTTAEMRATAGPAARQIDLRGRALIPGLMDNHLHGAGGGPGVDLSRARSLEDVYAAIRARAQSTMPGEAIVSNSDWHEAQLKEQRLPLRDDLDRVAPNHPVILIRGGHEYIVNSAVLRRWGVDDKATDPEGGRLTRYPDGRLNGELVDTARSLITLPPPPSRTREEQVAARVAEYKTLNAVGLTTVRHPGISVEDYRRLQDLQQRGLLTMRVNALLRPGGDAAAMARTLDESGLHQGDGDAWLRIGGIKLAVDGGFEGGLMRQPYQEPWGEGGTFRGLQTMDRERYTEIVRLLNQRGWRVATHAVGDAAIDMVLDAYERANAQLPITGRRWSIEHAFIGRRDHLPRMKTLGPGARRPEPSVSGRPQSGPLLGRGASGAHHARAHVPRRRTAGFVRHRRASGPLPAALDALSLRDPGHDLGRSPRSRSARHTRRGAAHGHDGKRMADDGRDREGLD